MAVAGEPAAELAAWGLVVPAAELALWGLVGAATSAVAWARWPLGGDDPATVTDGEVRVVPITAALVVPVSLDGAIAPSSWNHEARRSRRTLGLGVYVPPM